MSGYCRTLPFPPCWTLSAARKVVDGNADGTEVEAPAAPLCAPALRTPLPPRHTRRAMPGSMCLSYLFRHLEDVPLCHGATAMLFISTLERRVSAGGAWWNSTCACAAPYMACRRAGVESCALQHTHPSAPRTTAAVFATHVFRFACAAR